MSSEEESRRHAGAGDRSLALAAFQAAMAECSVARAMARRAHYERGALQLGEDLYDRARYQRLFVFSIGKAAQAMSAAFAEMLGSGAAMEGVVCAPEPAAPQIAGLRYFVGGHPLPNGESMLAARACLRSAEHLSECDLAVFLVSGGGSAVVEAPQDERLELADLIALNRALIGCGAPIAEINVVRKHLSAVKGGRLAAAAWPARQHSLFVSDVPEGHLDSLASGPSLPDSSTLEDCRRIVRERGVSERLSASLQEALRWAEETPKPDDERFARSRHTVLLENRDLCAAAASFLRAEGLPVVVDCSCDDWPAERAAGHLLDALCSLRQRHGAAAVVSGGELSVALPSSPGRGGRNQHFALLCAERLAAMGAQGRGVTVLSVGSDGVDGYSEAAGAVVDSGSLARAEVLGLSAANALRLCDSGSFFERTGEAVVTGPTGNNLRDLRILIAR